jgi:hypothetical protein
VPDPNTDDWLKALWHLGGVHGYQKVRDEEVLISCRIAGPAAEQTDKFRPDATQQGVQLASLSPRSEFPAAPIMAIFLGWELEVLTEKVVVETGKAIPFIFTSTFLVNTIRVQPK